MSIEIDESRDVYVPNVFSPNNDGVNDDFELGFSSGVEVIEEFHIFDRWGDRVFSIENVLVTDKIMSWDGTFKGEPQPIGTYIYAIEGRGLNGQSIYEKGNLTLIR